MSDKLQEDVDKALVSACMAEDALCLDSKIMRAIAHAEAKHDIEPLLARLNELAALNLLPRTDQEGIYVEFLGRAVVAEKVLFDLDL